MDIQRLSTYLAMDHRHTLAVGRALPDRVEGTALRTQEILTTAHNLLQERAAQISEGDLRCLFLENVPEHRMIVAACRVVHAAGEPAEETG